MSTLNELLEKKRHAYSNAGFKPVFMPDAAFDFQKALIEWSVEKGRSATKAKGKALELMADTVLHGITHTGLPVFEVVECGTLE